MKRYLVIEDLGERTDELHRAVKVLQRQGVDVILDHETRVNRLLDRGDYPVERLASYDAFFVDFHLSSDRFLARRPIEFPIKIGTDTVSVPATTGMGVLLYLTNLVKTERYQVERKAQASHLPAGRWAPGFYSFVEIQDVQSQFYATAAQSWFGATYFRAIAVADTLAIWLAKLPEWKGSAEPQLVRDAVVPFEQLMDCKLTSTRFAWGSLPEAYDWLRFYLEAGGRVGSLPEFRAVVARRTAMKVKWKNAPNEYSDRLDPIQNALKTLLETYAQGCTEDWPEEKFKLSDRPDRLLNILTMSSSFWMEPDVGFALKAHRARQLMRGTA